jgi:S-formylglutathione hydrolase FrmB
MKRFIQIILLLFILSSIVNAQGTLTTISFFSNSLDTNRYAQVYLPEGYNPEDSTRYPVIYYLHGALGNYASNPEIKGILDDLIGSNSIAPVIVVKPDGSTGPYAGSFYTNSELYGNFEDYICYDLVSFIDSAYKTIASKEKRAIWGHSMGAFGSIKIALTHPDIYCSVASHSGPMAFSYISLLVPTILSENGGAPVSEYIPNIDNLFTYFMFTMAGAFSPNLNNTYLVDIPIDSMGTFIDSTFDKWLLHDPVKLASNVVPGTQPAIYFDCGTLDEFFLYPFNTAFANTLDSLGLDYEFRSYTGGHVNQLIYRYPIALMFLDSVMNPVSGVYDNNSYTVSEYYLFQNYPNPFNPATKIKYSVPRVLLVQIRVFDILGNEIETLVNQEKPAGTYELTWNAANLSSGVYFYQLMAGDFIQTKKMILLR